jgi:dihydrodipicolinate synthase/N-acetylneuraminate lyase
MSIKERFHGIFTVVPTPLREDERIDHAGLRHLVNFYIESGCHGLVVLGSGGEFPYFSFGERLEIVGTTVKAAGKRVPVITGAGFCGMAETAEFIRMAGALRPDGFLVILPTYHPVPFDDALLFYRHICAVSKKPVLYYHYPQMTGLFYSPAQISRLLALDGMAGIKESSLNLREISKHLDTVRGRDFALFTGNSFSLLEALGMGGIGTICQIPSIAPRLVVECYNAYTGGDMTRARELQARILDLIPFLNTFDLPAGIQKRAYAVISRMPFSLRSRNRSRHAIIKETLRQLGHPVTARVRAPLPQITGHDREEIKRLLPTLGL